MWSFVVVDRKQELNENDFFEFLNSNFEDYEILYCSTRKIENENVINYTFDKNIDTETIINTVTSKCLGNNIVVVRNVKKYKWIADLAGRLENKNEVVFYKRHFSKINSFWYNLMTRIVNWAFNQNLNPIYNDVVVYGEVASTVLKNISNPSILMRTNSFTGVDFKYMEGDTGVYKFEYNKVKAILFTLIPLFVSLTLVIVKATTKFNASTALNLFYYSLIVLGIMFFSIFGLIWFIKTQIGDNKSGKAKYL